MYVYVTIQAKTEQATLFSTSLVSATKTKQNKTRKIIIKKNKEKKGGTIVFELFLHDMHNVAHTVSIQNRVLSVLLSSLNFFWLLLLLLLPSPSRNP